jgi:hypothetical protein
MEVWILLKPDLWTLGGNQNRMEWREMLPLLHCIHSRYRVEPLCVASVMAALASCGVTLVMAPLASCGVTLVMVPLASCGVALVIVPLASVLKVQYFYFKKMTDTLWLPRFQYLSDSLSDAK